MLRAQALTRSRLQLGQATVHKFKPGQKPQLRFDILLTKFLSSFPGFPIVLHGASSVIPEYVKMINDNGGNMPDAIGIPEDMLRQAARSAVCKINIDSDLRLAMTGSIRKYFAEHPSTFDPRQYLGPAKSWRSRIWLKKSCQLYSAATAKRELNKDIKTPPSKQGSFLYN